MVDFDGNTEAQVDNDMSTVAELCLEIGALDAYIVDTEERKKSVWNARGAFLEAIKASTTEMDECDVVVPRNKVAEYIKYTHALAKELDIKTILTNDVHYVRREDAKAHFTVGSL